MLATYHNHSTWSDGKANPAELAAAADALGVDELGISDHFVLHPAGERPRWSMNPDRLGEYVDAMLDLADRSPLSIRIGLEVDWFPGRSEALRRTLSSAALDYVIGSVHYVGDFTVDGRPERWANLSLDAQNQIHAEYWRRVRDLAESRLFDIVAHLDLTKKFGYWPTIDLGESISDALDAIAAANLVVELNTSGWHKPCADAYPSIDLLRECRRRDIPVTISADAHQPEHLLRDFGRAAERLKAAGYDEVARFASRERRLEPLREAIPAALP